MSSSQVEEIKSRLNIMDIIESYIKLEKAGQNHKARCPFHDEKTPSFNVSPSRDMYHCFGCGRGGDIFSFVQEIEGVDFSGALKILADRAGVKLSSYNRGLDSERDKLHRILEGSTKFFENKLYKHKEVLDYLYKRGLKDETIKNFRIGFAPVGWQNLYNFLKEKEVSDDLIKKAGLGIKGDRGLYDRFRGRIIFPIFDYTGKPIAFSGRIFEESKTSQDNNIEAGAKYINSPTTLLYDKSKALYGYDRAKVKMRKKDFCIVVEGQFDLVMSHQAGFENTIAISGTALTGEHLKNIQRFTNNLVFALDSDDAGFLALGRGMEVALSLGMEVKSILLSKDIDPADLIQKDKNLWVEVIEKSKQIIDFCIETFLNAGYTQRELSKKIRAIILPLVAKIESKVDQAHFVSKIARVLGIDETPVWEEVKKINIAPVILNKENEIKVNKKEKVSRRILIEEKILGVIFWQKEVKKSLIDTKDILEKYREIVGEKGFARLKEIDEKKNNEMITQAEDYYKDKDIDHLKSDISELMIHFEVKVLKENLIMCSDELTKANREEDQDKINEYLQKYNSIKNRIDELSNSFN